MSDGSPDVIYTGTSYIETYEDAYSFSSFTTERRYDNDVKYLLATPERELASKAFKLLRFIRAKIKAGEIAEDLRIEDSLELLILEADGYDFYI